MDYRIAAAVIAPLLVVQGLRVRRTALRMPEPPGPRSGREGSGPPLRLLVAGDSAAAGVGAPTQAEALSGHLVRALAASFSVSWTVQARTGLRTRDVLERFSSKPPGAFDAAVLSLGVNDVTGGTRSADFVARQRGLVTLLREQCGVQLVLLTALPPMHAFPALPQPLRWALGERAKAFTRLMASVASAERGCEVLELQLPLERSYMAEDGFHPGPRAYAIWGREAAAAIGRRFGPQDPHGFRVASDT